jgi:hypothetical protein
MATKVASMDISSPVTEGERTIIVRVPAKDAKVSSDVARVLSTLDVDGDGEITLPELINIVHSKETSDADNQRLRSYIVGGGILYLLTIAAFFGVAFGAGRILKDAFSLSGVSTDDNGRTLAQPTTQYAGEVDATDLISATGSQLASFKFLTFRLPTTDAVFRFAVNTFTSTPTSADANRWERVVLSSASGEVLELTNVPTVKLLIPGNTLAPEQVVDLTASNPSVSLEMAPLPGNFAVPAEEEEESGGGSGRRLQEGKVLATEADLAGWPKCKLIGGNLFGLCPKTSCGTKKVPNTHSCFLL